MNFVLAKITRKKDLVKYYLMIIFFLTFLTRI